MFEAAEAYEVEMGRWSRQLALRLWEIVSGMSTKRPLEAMELSQEID